MRVMTEAYTLLPQNHIRGCWGQSCEHAIHHFIRMEFKTIYCRKWPIMHGLNATP